MMGVTNMSDGLWEGVSQTKEKVLALMSVALSDEGEEGVLHASEKVLTLMNKVLESI